VRKSALAQTIMALLAASGSALWGVEKASQPNPCDGCVVSSCQVTLSWSPADYAERHYVYLGTAFDDVNECGFPLCDDILKSSQSGTSYSTGPLLMGQTYYWRVDELGGGQYAKGDTWSFTTPEWITVDDMESYVDRDSLSAAWTDGCGRWVDGELISNGTGSCIWLSTDDVHGGDKSMGYSYDNSGADRRKAYSEAVHTFDTASDWADNGEAVLVLWFYGDSGNDTEPMYVALGDSSGIAVSVYGTAGEDPNNIGKEEWQEWNISLQDFNSQSIDLSSIVSIGTGFGDRANPQPGGSGVVLFDDIRIYRRRCFPHGPESGDINGDCLVDSVDLGFVVDNWLDDFRFGPDPRPPAALPLGGDVSPSAGLLKTGFVLMTKDDYAGAGGNITWRDFGGTGIDLDLGVADHSASVCGFDTEGDDLCRDYFAASGRSGSPDADLVFALANLWPGSYVLTTYHNNADSNGSVLSSVDVGGAVSAWTGDANVVQTNDRSDANCGSSNVAFTATGCGEVSVRYEVGDDKQAWFNGFVLDCVGAVRKPYHPIPPDGAQDVGTNSVFYWSSSRGVVGPLCGESVSGTISTGYPAPGKYVHDYLLGTSVFNIGPSSGGVRLVGNVSNLSFGTAGDGGNGSWLEIGFIAKTRADVSISQSQPHRMFDQSVFLLAYKTSAGNLLVMPADTSMKWTPPSGGPGGAGGNESEYFDLGAAATCFWFVLDVMPCGSQAGGQVRLAVIGEGTSRTWRYGYDDWDWAQWKTGGIPDDPGTKEFFGDFEPAYAVVQGYANESGGYVYADITLTARQRQSYNNLALDAQTLDVRPGERVVFNMEVTNLCRAVAGCQAVLGYSSTYLVAGPGCVVPGDEPWHELIYNSWDIPGRGIEGEIDTAIGIDLNSATGTTADGTVAKITLTAFGEGTTQVLFRPDANDVESTMFADMNGVGVFANKLNSQIITIDENRPLFDVYLGDDIDVVRDANQSSTAYKATVDIPEYDAGTPGLELFKTYYWRIDERSGSGSVIKGDVWAFTTGCPGMPSGSGDLTGDCKINFDDYAVLAAEWLEELWWP